MSAIEKAEAVLSMAEETLAAAGVLAEKLKGRVQVTKRRYKDARRTYRAARKHAREAAKSRRNAAKQRDFAKDSLARLKGKLKKKAPAPAKRSAKKKAA